MYSLFSKDSISINNLSWEKSSRFVYIMQKRLFKAVYVGDLLLSFSLQKLILKSSSARLVSIRYVTQLCPKRKIPGVDGKIALTFSDRFELNQSLKNHYSSWEHENLRKVSILNKNGSLSFFKLSTISDRAWQHLIKLSIESAQEAFFHPTNFGFRVNSIFYGIQRFIYYNLSFYSFGFQKRLLEVDLSSILCNIEVSYLLKKLIAPRSIKLLLNNLISSGFDIVFPDSFQEVPDLSSLFANIILTGIEDIHLCVRFGTKIIFFLKPTDNELEIFTRLKAFLSVFCSNISKISINLLSPIKGIDFLAWHFKVSSFKECLVFPADSNYQEFLIRVKRIINNSNFGSDVKASKLFPVVKDWALYHKFSSLKGPRFSLFFIKKRALKSFSKESRQDFYSSKRLLIKCFYILDFKSIKFSKEVKNFLSSYGHVSFGFNFSSKSFNFQYLGSNNLSLFFPCIHCGVNSFAY